MASAPYLDSAQPIKTRITDLLARMNLAEKCAQLVGTFGIGESDDQFSPEHARQYLAHGICYVSSHHRKQFIPIFQRESVTDSSEN